MNRLYHLTWEMLKLVLNYLGHASLRRYLYVSSSRADYVLMLWIALHQDQGTPAYAPELSLPAQSFSAWLSIRTESFSVYRDSYMRRDRKPLSHPHPFSPYALYDSMDGCGVEESTSTDSAGSLSEDSD